MVRACQFCRRRKIRCDSGKPSCTACRNSNRTCVYHSGPAKPRPSTALLNALRGEKTALEDVLGRIKQASESERHGLLESVTISDGRVSLQDTGSDTPVTPMVEDNVLSENLQSYPTPSGSRVREATASYEEAEEQEEEEEEEDDNDDDVSSDGETGVSTFLSGGASGQAQIFSSTSAISVASPARAISSKGSLSSKPFQDQLIAKAAIDRHKERILRNLATIRGVPAELALHLLDLHWSRQHHTFLLTYRPTFMRELEHGGPYCSDLLLHAVFACSSKFSARLEVRTDPADPETAGRHFFDRCDELLLREGLLSQSRIPTIIALLMLGSTFIARGLTSKGWLYTGYALRMVYDLGLHLDSRLVDSNNAEEIEIRRRVFWGAFICEKLQSLYLGRPVTIRLRDAHVSLDFMDTFEELEPWMPYVDPKNIADSNLSSGNSAAATSTYSVSVFQQLCHLSKIMTKIINKIYFVGATARKTYNEIRPLDDALTAWYRNLPMHLVFEPWARDPMDPPISAAPNRIILLTTYHSLVILLHRPFISNSNTRSNGRHDTTNGVPSADGISASSWKRCATAARNISSLALAYRSIYPLRRSNYLLSYAVYVACTIHVLNAAALSGGENTPNPESSVLLGASLRCLDELAVPNSGVADTARIIRKLMAAKSVQESPAAIEFQTSVTQGLDSSWQMFSNSPNFDDFAQMQSFSDFDVVGHDLLFGFMSENTALSTFDMDGNVF